MLVKVYPYKAYDIKSDQLLLSDHYATEDCIKQFGNLRIATECYYVSVDDLDGDGRILKAMLHELLSQNSARTKE
jgi:hypothetical protein